MFSHKPTKPLPGLVPSSFFLWFTGLILLASALITSAIGHTAAPRSMPDERHHYSVIKHIADNFGQFPLDYRAIRTDTKADPNHLVHPPLYHYLIATGYVTFNPDRHFTWAGQSYDRNGSIATSTAVIPMLRGFSLFWVFLGLLGTFFLLREAVNRALLSPFTCVLCAIFLSFIATFLYIGGGISNDVMGLVIWPWLILAVIRYMADHNLKAFWGSWFLLGALLLTKASFWVMVLAVGLLLGLRAMVDLKRSGLRQWFNQHHRQWSAWIIAAGAVFLWFLGFIHLKQQWQEHGQLQPSYETVYQIPYSESKFLIANNIENIHPRSEYEIAHLCAKRLTRSLRGNFNHLERTTDPYVTSIFYLSCLAVFLILAGSLQFWRDKNINSWFKSLTAISLILPVLNFVLLLQINFAFYNRTQNIAIEGRYFAGYIHLAIFALFILANHTVKALPNRKTGSFLVAVGLLILGGFYIRPMQYFKQSHEIFFQAKMTQIIPKHLKTEGYARLQVRPENLHLKPYRHLKWYPRLGDYYPLFSPGDELVFHLPATYHDWDLLIWVESSGKPSRSLYLKPKGPSGRISKPTAIELPLPSKMDLLKVTIPASQMGSGTHWVISPSAPATTLATWLPKSLKPQFGPVKLFGVFMRPAEPSSMPEWVNTKKGPISTSINPDANDF